MNRYCLRQRSELRSERPPETNRTGSPTRLGFVLVEVLIAVAILSVSVVVILESLAGVSRASARAGQLMEASSRLENRMAELLAAAGCSCSADRSSVQGGEPGYVFSCLADAQPFQGEAGLQTLTISEKWGRGSTSLTLITAADAKPCL